MSEKKTFLKNLAAAFMAQGISLLLSIAMSLIVPRFLGVEQFSYWQLFIFYTGYVGFFHFGFCDGVYLRLGGKQRSELDCGMLKQEMWIFGFSELILALVVTLGAVLLVSVPERRVIWAATAAYMVINNLTLYFGYIFQAVNETSLFSKSVMIDRVFVLAGIVLLLLFGADSFVPFIVVYTLAKTIALVYCIYEARDILKAKAASFREAWQDVLASTKVGINLTIANIASMLILGIGRIVIDNAWGIETFGKISLSLSITNFFLLFIQQVSMVMFPALRRINKRKLKQLFASVSGALNVVLPAILLGYIPVKLILTWWLPQYEESLRYLALLLPLCLFDGKMQMLFNTYLKVLRKEKIMLKLNVTAFVLSGLLCSLFGFIFHTLTGVVLSMLAAIAVRSLWAESWLDQHMKLPFDSSSLYEIGYIVLFILASWWLPAGWAFLSCLLGYLCYLLLNRQQVEQLWGMVCSSLPLRKR